MFRGFITIVLNILYLHNKKQIVLIHSFSIRLVFFLVKFTTSHNDVNQYHCETIKVNFNGYLNYLSYMSKIKPQTRYFCVFYEHFKLDMFQIKWNFKNLKSCKTRFSQFRKMHWQKSIAVAQNEVDDFGNFYCYDWHIFSLKSVN